MANGYGNMPDKKYKVYMKVEATKRWSFHLSNLVLESISHGGVLERRGASNLPTPIRVTLGIPRLYHTRTRTCDFWSGRGSSNSIDMYWQKHKEACTWMFHDASKVFFSWMIPVVKGVSTRNTPMIGWHPEKMAPWTWWVTRNLSFTSSIPSRVATCCSLQYVSLIKICIGKLYQSASQKMSKSPKIP